MTAAAGILVTILVFYRVIISHPGSSSLVGAKFGAYLGLLFCIGIAIGGWRSMQDEGTSFREAGESLSSGTRAPSDPPAPPVAPPPPRPRPRTAARTAGRRPAGRTAARPPPAAPPEEPGSAS